MTGRQFVSYLRVSTQKQGGTGLGIEAQRRAVAEYLAGARGEQVAELVEVESGKRNDRPKLAEALALCRKRKAVLVIAKLDRLARNLAFIANLMDAGVEFVACDMPLANKLTLHIFAAVAEHERDMISARTKAALAVVSARGKPLGWRIPSRAGEARRASQIGVERRIANADAFARRLLRTVRSLQRDGATTLQAIADGLNAEGHTTPRGGSWRPGAVARLLQRAEGLAPQGGGKGAQVAPPAERAA